MSDSRLSPGNGVSLEEASEGDANQHPCFAQADPVSHRWEHGDDADKVAPAPTPESASARSPTAPIHSDGPSGNGHFVSEQESRAGRLAGRREPPTDEPNVDPAAKVRSSNAQRLILLPRAIRSQDALAYLGVDRNKFNAEFKPRLTVVVLGHRTRCYDRLDLDRIWEEIKARNGRPGADDSEKEATSWENAHPASTKRRTERGSSTSVSSDSAFTSALDRAIAKSRKRI